MPTFALGGAEIVAIELANGLSELGWDMSIVVLSGIGELRSRVNPMVEIVSLESARYRLAIRDLAAFYDRRKPDLVLSTLYINNIVAIFARMRSTHKPLVIAGGHNSLKYKISHPDNRKDKYLLYPLSRAMMRFADMTIAVSQGVADELRAVLRLRSDRIRVIYNPIYKPELEQLAREPVVHPWLVADAVEVPILVTVGRLIEQKGHSDLIKALAILNTTRTVRLLVIGDGPRRADLERQTEQLSLAGLVDFLGQQDNPLKYVARADVFVLSSRWEGLANVIVESLACGCPVVSTDCNFGPRELLDGDRFGLLAKVGSPADLAAKINLLLDEPSTKQRKDKSALLDRAKIFSRANSVEGYRRVIELMLESKKRRRSSAFVRKVYECRPGEPSLPI